MKRRTFLRSLATLAVGIVAIPHSDPTEARIGRPATPGSVAGVRRRTRRRTRRRVYRHMTLYSLPYGCNTMRVQAGVNYHYCGGIWYRPVYQGTTVVYIVEDIDSGANTSVEFEE
jgi:hypothetical protein